MNLQDINQSEILYMTIKKVFFDQILSGEKTEEYREPTDYWFKRLYVIENNEAIEPKPFKYVRFCVGYNRDREEALVEIKSIKYFQFLYDIPDGFEKGDTSIVIELGRTISKKLKNAQDTERKEIAL